MDREWKRSWTKLKIAMSEATNYIMFSIFLLLVASLLLIIGMFAYEAWFISVPLGIIFITLTAYHYSVRSCWHCGKTIHFCFNKQKRYCNEKCQDRSKKYQEMQEKLWRDEK